MGYGSKLGRAQIDSSSPSAAGVCDRCGFVYNHKSLRWQWDYRGRSLANTRILVCETCLDKPQPQLKPRILPPDPVSIANARPERYRDYETNTRVTQGNSIDFWTGLPISGGDVRTTQDLNTRTTQATGEPPYGLDNTPGTNLLVPGDNDLGPAQGLPYGYNEVPKTGPLAPYVIQINWKPSSGSRVSWSNNFGGSVGWNTTVPSTSNQTD